MMRGREYVSGMVVLRSGIIHSHVQLLRDLLVLGRTNPTVQLSFDKHCLS